MEEDVFRTVSWREIKEASMVDKTVVKINNAIREGFPAHITDLDSDLRPLWNKREWLYTLEEVTMFGERLYIPPETEGHGPGLPALSPPRQGNHGENSGRKILLVTYAPGHRQKRDQCRTCDRMAPS